jgi:DegV family protein with EDD domain
MSKIIADSSLDINEELEELNISFAPFKLYLDKKEFIDDEKLNVVDFIKQMGEYPGVPKTSCPAPQDFLNLFEETKDNFVVTISEALSGTFNSAKLAKKLFDEKDYEGFVHVFNSKSASVGETLVGVKIKELLDKKISRDILIENVEKYIGNMRTFFVSESLDNLMKNGRISKFKGTMALIFNIKPVMGTNTKGEIILYKKCRGVKKAYNTLKNIVKENAGDTSDKILAISHVNNVERANYLKEMFEKECKFKKIIVVQTGGLTSLYCDNQGIILAF